MSTYKPYPLALVACLSLVLCSCATQVAARAGSWHFAIGTSLADPRISEKLITIGPDGQETQIGADKYAASEQFLAMIEATLPQIVEAAVRAALASAGISAVGDLLDGLGNGELDGVPEIMEEVVPE